MSTTEEQIAEEMSEDADVPANVDPETGEILEPDAEPQAQTEEAAAPRSQKEIDAVQDKLKSEAARHEKRLREIMGEDFGFLVLNPTDWTPGYIFNIPEMHPAPEQVAELHALLGDAAPPELNPATDAEGCPDCNALGEVLTGSRKPGQVAKPCTGCGGLGWKPKLAQPQNIPTIFPAANGAGTGLAVPNQPIAADQWGRPYGHRDYGVDPSRVNG